MHTYLVQYAITTGATIIPLQAGGCGLRTLAVRGTSRAETFAQPDPNMGGAQNRFDSLGVVGPRSVPASKGKTATRTWNVIPCNSGCE